MCGICGFVGQGDAANLISMRDRMVHRGPDDQGHYFEPGIGLGHRRLSIIDLSTGRQPISNEAKDHWVVFNGEIYNFRETRILLEKQGHVFTTNTDTEVIVHAYEEWGDECLQRFRGMFAFALWDARRKRLLLARDRLGIKPLYYAVVGSNLIFASEIKALLMHPLVSRDLDPAALDMYLRLDFIPSPHTIFRSVRKLPPAHRLVMENGNLAVTRYWKLHFEPEFRSEEEWLDAVEAKILEAVRIRLIADVPLGAFLSGGIDSSIVVLAMSRLMQEPIKTFAIGFDDPQFDERSYARQIARRCGTNHHEHVVARGLDEDTFSQLVAQLDEPMSDGSFIPTFHVSRLARSKVTVALSGDGGDESFAGYAKYATWLKWQKRWGRAALPSFLGRGIRQVAGTTVQLGRRTLTALSLDPIGRFAELTYRYYSMPLNELYGDAVRTEIRRRRRETDVWRRVANEVAGDEPLTSVQHADMLTYLPEDILMKVDKMSMLTSLEVRVPLLDHELQELLARMPPDLKLRANTSKYLLKGLLERWGASAEFIHRSKKGFAPSTSYWFPEQCEEKMQADVRASYSVKEGIFTSAGIDAAIARNDSKVLWNIWIFEHWARHYLA